MSHGVELSLREVAGSALGPWDVLVVGAGPAGSTAARELALRGRRVLLVDRQQFPRPKVCGCCIAPVALDQLRAAGLGDLVASAGGVPLRSLRVGVRNRVYELPLEGGRGLSRGRLDAALLDAATTAGAHRCLGARATAGEVVAGGRRVRLSVGDESVEMVASVIVAADGVGSPFLRAARELDGAADVESPAAAPVRVGVGARLPTPAGPDVGEVVMAVDRGGYVGLVRLEDGRCDVAAALDRERLAEFGPASSVSRILERSGHEPARLGVEGTLLEEADWSGTPPLRRRVGPLTAARVVAVGDAGGYWEPFTGEGIAWAIQGARGAAPTIAALAERWSSERAVTWARDAAVRRRRRQRHCRRVAAAMARPRLAGLILGLLERWPDGLSWALPGQRFLASGSATSRLSGRERPA